MVIRTLKAFTMRNADTGKLTSLGMSAIVTVDTTLGNKLIADGFAEEYSPLVPEGTKSIVANGNYDVTQYATASVDVTPTLNIVATALEGDVALLGKTADDLQTDVAITNGNVTGELKYVTGYTGFSSKVEEQSGNYLAFKVEADADSITVELINGTLGHPVTLDSDGMIVLRIADTSTQSIEIVATKGNFSEKRTLTISSLVLDSEN